MKEPIIDYRFFIRMAVCTKRTDGLSDEEIAAFCAAISVKALEAKGQDEDGALRPSTDFPGYLHRTIDRRDVFVPFNLASVFPGARLLKCVCSLSDAVRLAYGHPLCLAGSTTFLGRLGAIADIDFCEYFASAVELLVPAVMPKAKLGAHPYLVGIKCSDRVFVPGPEFSTELQAAIVDPPLTSPCHPVKLDFVSETAEFGLLPTTSVVLPVLLDGSESGNFSKSFAYQEAILSVASPPRGLLNPERFAEYFIWLIEEAKIWLSDADSSIKGPLKALKRMLSAFLLIGYEFAQDDKEAILQGSPSIEQSDPLGLILNSLNGGTLARVARDLSRRELQGLSADARRLLPDRINALIESDQAIDQEIVTEALEAAVGLAEGLVEFLQSEIDFTQRGVTEP